MDLLITVWKSTRKRYHAEIFSVKPHNKMLLILLLQMDGFLYLGGISGSSNYKSTTLSVCCKAYLAKRLDRS